jgi:sigma-B regulation protein RsbU (phosphoserine phosphatase)
MPEGRPPTTDAVATRRFRAHPVEVTAIDQWIKEVAARRQGEWAVFRTRLCVAEIAANVVEHGTRDHADAEIVVTLDQSDAGIDIEIADSGRPFDPTAVEPVAVAPVAAEHSIETTPIGGRGLRILRAFARNLSYRRDGNFNHVRMHVPAEALAGQMASGFPRENAPTQGAAQS